MKRIVDRKELTSSEKTPSQRDAEEIANDTEVEGGTEE
jgi:hypothetical protein